jgi:lipopolysaccharide transport system ATP-binding protein
VRRKHNSILDLATDALLSPIRRIRSFGRSSYSEADSVWALRDVSFDVRRGEVLGLIGSNGAGKSTLLKVLSRITYPTAGQAVLNGRVGSLLEIGTGFHGELTGRENIYVSGAILGMQRREIQKHFDEIVEFAGIGSYLDTPVKRYSSGMRVRLGFAVAAHLQPEILLIDEVLAVGDAEFQAKCLGRMDSIGKGGRTVLFVSHDMNALQEICPRSILLDGGCVVAQGETSEVIKQYLDLSQNAGGIVEFDRDVPKANVHSAKWFSPQSMSVLDKNGAPTDTISLDKPFTIEVMFDVSRKAYHPELGIECSSRAGVEVAYLLNRSIPESLAPGRYVAACHVPAGLFGLGVIRLGLRVREPRTRELFACRGLLELKVGLGSGIHAASGRVSVRPPCEWEMRRE